jgi:formate/nitrite transporter FocA (FNT family)
MSAEQQQWDQLRAQAQGYLPADFARQVVRRAQHHKRRNRREYVVIAITAGFCLVTVAVANWYLGNQIQDRNLTLWSVAAAQISALRTSL